MAPLSSGGVTVRVAMEGCEGVPRGKAAGMTDDPAHCMLPQAPSLADDTPARTSAQPCIAATLAVAATLFATLGLTACGLARRPPTGRPDEARVERPVDGDTLVVRIGGHDETVRLLGIDTPETKDPRKPVQCYGKEASARLAQLAPPGTRLRVRRDVEARDRYGRLLLYVWRTSDGLFVNLALAREGAAVDLTILPNHTHTPEIRAAVHEAEEAGRGLWGKCGGPGHPAPSDDLLGTIPR